MEIKISKETYKKLKWMAKHWFVCDDEKAMPITKVIKTLVDDEYCEANPNIDNPYDY